MVPVAGANVKPGAAHNAPTQHGAGLNPADGADFGLPYPWPAKGRKISKYRKRTWEKKMRKRIREQALALARLVG